MDELLKMAGTSSAFFLEGRLRTAELAQQVIDEFPRDSFSNGDSSSDRFSSGETEGSRIGRYTLIRRKIDEGCGEVFEAVQDGMARTVALKIIRTGMDTESVVSRFETERQTLEIMEHPNIASVLDFSRTSRRPYFVMELVTVRGSRAFAKPGNLESARGELFLKVCHAIQHARQKGIVPPRHQTLEHPRREHG